MADILLNFSSDWPSVQVAKVVAHPHSLPSTNGVISIEHGLGYPPLALGLGVDSSRMEGIECNNSHILYNGSTPFRCIIIYALDISTPHNYPYYSSSVGDLPSEDSKSKVDLRKFLLNSDTVSPMVLNVTVSDIGMNDAISYTSPLPYPTFQFGFVKVPSTNSWVWANPRNQSWPAIESDGYTAEIRNSGNSTFYAEKVSIITLRNPSIVVNNSETIYV